MGDVTSGEVLHGEATVLLRRLVGRDDAVLHTDQWRAISAVVEQRRPTLVVQRTGFGKSAVYGIATRLLRDRGAGPALCVSPLIALMRDQVASLSRMGLNVATLNSANFDDWTSVEEQLADGHVDLLLVSPERLNSPRFARAVLPRLSAGLGLLVVDEAHCVSDWGHDFRPDYRRLRTAIGNLAPGTPVLATTATANARVCVDVADQIGADALVLRGTLDRESLHLGVVDLPDPAARLAWTAERIAATPGTGIVYCLTVDAAERTAAFLASRGLAVAAYTGRTDPGERERIEGDLQADRVRAVVATSALGMGVDKADLRFVVHLGAPPSPISYYQQVGRAGRGIDRADAWLLPGAEDRAVWAWMTSVGLPARSTVEGVLGALDLEEPKGIGAIEAAVDLRRSRLDTLLRILDVDGAVERVDGGWVRTGAPWHYDADRVARVEEARREEAAAMVEYARPGHCRMRFLRERLDDPGASDCGRCDHCTGGPPATVDAAVLAAAVAHLRNVDVPVEPRRRWPAGLDAPWRGAMGPRAPREGRALSRVGDAGWWPLVEGVLAAGAPAVDDELVDGVFAALRRWPWEQRPTWVTWLGADTSAAAAVAARVAAAGRMGLHRTFPAPPGPHSGGSGDGPVNSATRVRSLLADRSAPVVPAGVDGPVLLIVDRVGTRWGVTVAAARLVDAGAGPVLPFTLALGSS